ncbi:polycystic kidney disease protein 1-like 2 [Patella vulgata]|uniref:polycystic kidney disease protein 1-like 2 n=1 Tax=Patella vulgata TaxID=6465 RepID=UPI0021800322|nr:polycystic kidney disease protein 1-like 2 [Patella vulgata]
MHFLMATPSCVGPLQYLHIWHDNSGNGNDASWYLDKVEIRDLQKKEKFEFPCSLWLAVEEGTLEKALPIAGYEDMSALKTILYKYAAKHVSDDHIWLSLLLRPVKSHFTRVQRVFCCYALLMLTMIANAMFFDQVDNKDREQKSDFKMGSIRFNMQDLYISLISVIITALPIYVIMVLFQKSKLNFSKDAKKPCCLPPFYRKVYEDSIQLDKVLVMKGLVDDEDGVLPHFFIYVAWFLVFVSSFLSAFFLLLYTIEWGQSLSELWLTSFFLSIFESIILVDPFKVIIGSFNFLHSYFKFSEKTLLTLYFNSNFFSIILNSQTTHR